MLDNGTRTSVYNTRKSLLYLLNKYMAKGDKPTKRDEHRRGDSPHMIATVEVEYHRDDVEHRAHDACCHKECPLNKEYEAGQAMSSGRF